MQPDPEVFLPAMRRELTNPELFGKGLEEGYSRLVMYRIAETLAQLTLRHTRLPQVLRETLPVRAALLRDALQALPDVRSDVEDAIARADALHGMPPGEADIKAYEAWTDAVCACIAALSARQHESPDLDRLLVKLRNMGSQLEMDVRGLYKQELEAIKVKLEQLEDPSPLPQPTDAELTGVLRAHFPELRDIGTSNVRRIAGVTAKETFFFDLRNCPGWPVGMVLRRESKFNATRTFVADELPLLNRLHDEGIPVPRALIADAEGRGLRAGFIMVERLSGAPRTAEQWGPSGPQIALEMAAILARIHRIDPRTLDAPYQAAGSSSQAEVLRRLEDFYKRWVESRTETTVSLEAAYSWMREHVGCVGPELSLVHGDCNFRNILLDGDRISALLDWELAHPGHAAEDLAYIKGDVEKIMPWSGFLEVYRQHGGVPVTDDAIRYFEIWANVWRTTLAQNCHAAYVKGDHDSYLYGSVGHNEYYASLDPLGAAMISL